METYILAKNSRVLSQVFQTEYFCNKQSSSTTTRATLRKQATYLRKNKNLNVTISHTDERGTREYNLALG